MLRDSGRPEVGARHAADDDPDAEDDEHADLLATDVRPDVSVPGFSSDFGTGDEHATDVLDADLIDEDDDVRDVHPAAGLPDRERSVEDLLDEVADHDTVVLARADGDPDSADPRAKIPAWEDIVFGVRRHR
jgi:hypothetical protein